MPDGVVVVDEAGTIRLVNRQMGALFGYEPEELLSQRIEFLVPDSVRDRHPGNRSRYVVEPRVRPMGTGLELAGRRKDGTEFPVDITLSPIETDDGLFVMAAVRDISERKQAERERAALEDQLRQARKMEALGQLAGGIAHDFNNLITAIRGFAELVHRHLPPDDARDRADLEQVLLGADRAAALTGQLLAFARKSVLEPQIVDPSQVVARLVPMLQRLLGEHIEVVAAPAAETLRMPVDPTQLEQLIVNLAVNARDAMLAGGRLTIETAGVDLDAGYAADHPYVAPGRYVLLAVSDTGVGIDRATMSRMFEPFFTTKEVGRGTGLGLATAFGIVKQSGGSIEVYSEPGHGTSFKLYFPRGPDEAAVSIQAEPAGAVTGGPELILLVEDDDAVRGFALRTLEALGYRVLEAATGTAALAVVAEHPGGFDLLVSDVVLPGIQGPELWRQLRAIRPGLRTLFVSGFSDHRLIEEALDQGKVSYLGKPYSGDALGRAVRSSLDEPGSG